MYNPVMKRIEITKILKKYSYSDSSINSILSGRRLPSMAKAIEMSEEIPVYAWKDIKSFLSDNRTIPNNQTNNTQQPNQNKVG
jgi:hypothetical protein